jgi:hypothetical protein
MAKVIVQKTLVSFLRDKLKSVRNLSVNSGKTLSYYFDGERHDIGFIDSKEDVIVIYTDKASEHSIDRVIFKLQKALEDYGDESPNPFSESVVKIKLVVS